jgi:chaperonin GroEL
MSERILKDIVSGDDAKNLLLSGLKKASDVVSSTYGYRGRTVLIESDYGRAEPTKDGYKTLQSIFLENPVENIALEIAKEASEKTVKFAGDSTTNTIILLYALFKNSVEAVKNGKSPISVKQEIEQSRDLILEHLDKISTPITDKLIYDVALTSANGDVEIAKIVSEAYIKAGADGSVSHARSNTDESYLEFIEGTLVESGYADERFVNVFSDRTCVFDENPIVVCSTIEFKTVKQILPFMQYAHDNKRPLVIIADCAPAVKDVVLQNVIQKGVPFCIINCPGVGKKRLDSINDLACVLGTQAITTLSGDNFEGREGEFIGECEKIVVGKADTIITPIKNNYVQKIVDGKILEIKEAIKTTKSQVEEKYLRERIAKLVGGVSIIKIGSIIESELQEKIDRVDDAVCAVRSAKEEGVLPGGGIALMGASLFLSIADIVKNSLKAPFIKLLENASVDAMKINTDFVTKQNFGYDVKNFCEVNMFEAGIVDSTKAIKHALINAVSASNTMLMTDNVLTNARLIQNGN